jgi:hypothetical protein
MQIEDKRDSGSKGKPITVEIERINGEPTSIFMRPRKVELMDCKGGKEVHIKISHAELLTLKGDLRSVLHNVAPSEFPRLSQFTALNGQMWAVRLRPKNRRAGEKMLTYQSAGGTVFNAQRDEIPTEMKLISNEEEVKELREMGSQFEIAEITMHNNNVDGQVEALLSEIERLQASLTGDSIEVEAFTKLQTKSDLFCNVLRAKADAIAASIKATGERLVAEHQKRGRDRAGNV